LLVGCGGAKLAPRVRASRPHPSRLPSGAATGRNIEPHLVRA
jgi:hypothetical protein